MNGIPLDLMTDMYALCTWLHVYAESMLQSNKNDMSLPTLSVLLLRLYYNVTSIRCSSVDLSTHD